MNFNTLITVLPVFIKSKFICISDLIISRLPAFLLVLVISSLSVSCHEGVFYTKIGIYYS